LTTAVDMSFRYSFLV